MFRFLSLFAIAFGLISAPTVQAADLVVEQAFARITPSGSGGAFMTIHNRGGADRLVGVSSPSADRAEIHVTKMEDGVMKMRPVEAIEVAPGGMTALESGGPHVMLFGVPKGLKPGDSIEILLTFEQAGEVAVVAEVQPPGRGKEHAGHGEGHGESHGKKHGEAMAMAMEPLEVTVNRISPDGVGEAIGSFNLAPIEGGVLLTPAVTGLEPGPHAFHVHTNPDCGPGEKDGKKVAGLAAGGHFDPAKGSHGGSHGDSGGHGHKPAGDLPELQVDDSGAATQAVEITTLTLDQIMGRAIMVHAYGENPADPEKPKGGGPRVACAVVAK